MTGTELQKSFLKKKYRTLPPPKWDLFEPAPRASVHFNRTRSVERACQYVSSWEMEYASELISRAIHSITTESSEAAVAIRTFMWLKYYSLRAADPWRNRTAFAKDAGMIMCMLYCTGNGIEAKWLAKRILAGEPKFSWYRPEFTSSLLVTACLILGDDMLANHRHRLPPLGIFDSTLDAFESSDTNWRMAVNCLCDKHMEYAMDPDYVICEPFPILPVEVLALMRLREAKTGRKVRTDHPVVNMPFLASLETADMSLPQDKWLDMMLWIIKNQMRDPDDHQWFDAMADAELAAALRVSAPKPAAASARPELKPGIRIELSKAPKGPRGQTHVISASLIYSFEDPFKHFQKLFTALAQFGNKYGKKVFRIEVHFKGFAEKGREVFARFWEICESSDTMTRIFKDAAETEWSFLDSSGASIKSFKFKNFNFRGKVGFKELAGEKAWAIE